MRSAGATPRFSENWRPGVWVLPLEPRYRQRSSLIGLIRQAARDHNSLIIFPQGNQVQPEQEYALDPAVKFRPGVGYLAQALPIPIVLFGLEGTEAVIPPIDAVTRSSYLRAVLGAIKRRPLALYFGEPLMIRSGEAPAAFALRLQTTCYDLTQQAEQMLDRNRRPDRK